MLFYPKFTIDYLSTTNAAIFMVAIMLEYTSFQLIDEENNQQIALKFACIAFCVSDWQKNVSFKSF